jgi:predicted transport protein
VPIYSEQSGTLKEISEETLGMESYVQKLVERNMKSVFHIEFVASEFRIKGLRVDSLGFDKESKSFVIVEYKRDRNSSVVDQGLAYLALMLKNKGEFIQEYNEKAATPLKRDDIDWTQSRVIFVAPFFTDYQKMAIGFKDLPIELWEVKKYSNNIVLFNQIQSTEKAESIAKISRPNENVRVVSREIVTYTEDSHLQRCDDKTKAIYNDIKTRITNLSPTITVKVRKMYIAFANNDRNFLYLSVKRSSLELHLSLKKGELTDPKKIAIDISNKAHFQGVTQYLLKVDNKSDLGYSTSLITQAFDKTRSSSE